MQAAEVEPSPHSHLNPRLNPSQPQPRRLHPSSPLPLPVTLSRLSRQAHCNERLLPEAGAWLQEPPKVAIEFRQWISRLAHAFPVGSQSAHLFGSRSHGNEIDPWFNASQLSWLVDAEGRMLVRDVIKLEELEKRWPHLQRSICGLRGVAYGTDPTATARRNPSAHKHYSYYYDEVARRIVERYVAADLQAFGYKFEDIVDK